MSSSRSFERKKIIGMMEAGWPDRRVARQLGRFDCVVRRCWDQCIREISFTRSPGSGCSRQTSPPSLEAPVFSQIIRRRLFEGHLRSWRPLRLLPLTPTHRRLRLEWCHEQEIGLQWNGTRSSYATNPDSISSEGNRVREWRHRGERLNPSFALQRHTTPTAGGMRLLGTIFQHDNARSQTSRVSKDCLRIVTALPWSTRSQDLSPIEHAWDHLGRRVGHSTSFNELQARIQKLWNEVSQDIIQNLYA
ncbi:transposable element Tcb2 transposase [Trichonephila clavipes]|nr:transposable element Tcb2 transposase [Trichonephila clavipes]